MKKLRLWVKLLFLFLIVGGTYLGVKSLKKENISEESKSVLKENNIPLEKYSKTLEFVLDQNLYNEKYLDQYRDIEYSDKNNFKDVINIFLDKGYKGKEINYIMNLSNKNIDKLKNVDYIDIKDYYSFKNFDVNNVNRYNLYREKHSKYELKDIVTYVNIKLDLPVYTDTLEAVDPSDLLVLVNKYNSLPKNYKPSGMEQAAGHYGNNVPMRKEAKEALEKLQESVKKEIGITLLPTTAYRDYNFQNTLYTGYVSKHGKEKADTYSARPGYSDHQTGLAIDLKNPAIKTNVRLNDSDYEWLHNNAYRFGFIIRFPKGKEFITGYQFENWHIRYVGLDVAKIIYENDLTLEEYIDLYVTEY